MLKKIVLAAGTAAVCFLTAQSAQAGTLHQGWNYSIDAFGDGSGGSIYDIKGLAIKETAEDIYVSISANLPLSGNSYSGAADGNIGWGDLFFNFSGDSFNTANSNHDLFGIRFAGTNDSGVQSVGVYGNVSAKSVTGQNSGYSSLQQYYNYGWEKANTFGSDLTTKTEVFEYFAGNQTGDNTTPYNVIESGTFLGDISWLDANQAAGAGLDFGHFGATGDAQLTFKFARNLLPSNNFFAHLFLECANDGVGIESVPEPSGLAGIALLGLVFGRHSLRGRFAKN